MHPSSQAFYLWNVLFSKGWKVCGWGWAESGFGVFLECFGVFKGSWLEVVLGVTCFGVLAGVFLQCFMVCFRGC